MSVKTNEFGAVAFSEGTRRYFPKKALILNSLWAFLVWMITVSFRSYFGSRAIRRYVDEDGAIPAIWHEDFAGKHVLIIGTGPSLDRAGPEFFNRFDTSIHINFALRKLRRTGAEYFFTTDMGPIREFMDAHGSEPFEYLGREHCIYAPYFLDTWHRFTEAGRKLFVWMRPDATRWTTQSVGPLDLPLILRYYPRFPDWRHFNLPPPGRALPIVRPTSALSAIIFAAMNGAKEIGLIGCDFSAGRADAAASSQSVPGAEIFADAPAQFYLIKERLAGIGITLTNHSWEI